MWEFFRCTEAEAKAMVVATDRDGDGFINIEEFGTVVENRFGGEDLTAKRCTEIIMVLDSDGDGDGTIFFDDFKAMMATK
ncbi:hypothetical protein ABZP36_031855 [Zizania latifolia]